MKNKLLLTTAISTLALSSFAVAETKITGSLDISYNAQSSQDVANSDDGFGRESQINVSNSGELDNGMSYAAGFSLEFDGSPDGTNANSISNENLYIDFTSGNTTLSIGQDHGLHTDSSAVPRVSIPANSFMATTYTQGAAIGDGATHIKEGMGVYVQQKFDGGAIQLRYTPHSEFSGGKNDAITADDEGGGYDINLQGNLGVEGLKVNAQYAKIEKALSSTNTSARDSKGKALTASYNFGQFTVGAGKIERELGTATTAERNTDDFGITFAASDNLSLGLNYAETEKDNGANDEKITMVQVGYSLGAVGISLGYADVENYGNAANTDHEQGFVRLSTKF